MPSPIRRFVQKKLRLTENRVLFARVISESKDHPDVEEVYNLVLPKN